MTRGIDVTRFPSVHQAQRAKRRLLIRQYWAQRLTWQTIRKLLAERHGISLSRQSIYLEIKRFRAELDAKPTRRAQTSQQAERTRSGAGGAG